MYVYTRYVRVGNANHASIEFSLWLISKVSHVTHVVLIEYSSPRREARGGICSWVGLTGADKVDRIAHTFSKVHHKFASRGLISTMVSLTAIRQSATTAIAKWSFRFFLRRHSCSHSDYGEVSAIEKRCRASLSLWSSSHPALMASYLVRMRNVRGFRSRDIATPKAQRR